jgi:excisionase family DNA binding protein
MTNRMLKGEEVSAILNVSRSQAFSLMKRGDIPTVRIGSKCVRVMVEDLEKYLSENRITHGQPVPKK